MRSPVKSSADRRPGAGPHGRSAKVAAAALGMVLVAAVSFVAGKEGPLTAYEPGWRLVFHDEFDGGQLDQDAWNAQDLPSPRNNELQHYSPELVSVGDGRLRLTSEQVARGGRPFSSAAVDTYGKFAFLHGRVEVRAKLPEMGQGLWPAVWLLGSGCNPTGSPCAWPTTGSEEIDIMEGVNLRTRMFTDLHHGTSVGTSLSTGAVEHAGPDLGARFHTFAVEWEPGGVARWYRDDDLLSVRTVPGAFSSPMSLILNTAVGGDWPGPPSADTVFPQHFDVDFVRVYQRA
jgi:beta-glucanase (GH16 family)